MCVYVCVCIQVCMSVCITINRKEKRSIGTLWTLQTVLILSLLLCLYQYAFNCCYSSVSFLFSSFELCVCMYVCLCLDWIYIATTKKTLLFLFLSELFHLRVDSWPNDHLVCLIYNHRYDTQRPEGCSQTTDYTATTHVLQTIKSRGQYWVRLIPTSFSHRIEMVFISVSFSYWNKCPCNHPEGNRFDCDFSDMLKQRR